MKTNRERLAASFTCILQFAPTVIDTHTSHLNGNSSKNLSHNLSQKLTVYHTQRQFCDKSEKKDKICDRMVDAYFSTPFV